MMTCTSDRSGIASSGVRRTAKTPAATTNSAPRSTIKTLRADHSIMRPSMSVPLARGAGWLCPGRLNANNGVLAARLASQVEHDSLARFERTQQRCILDLEIHGHRRPLQAGDRAVRECYAGLGRSHRFHRALAAMCRRRRAGGGRSGSNLALGLCAISALTEAAKCRFQVALGVDEEVRADHHVLACFDALQNFDVSVAALSQFDLARLEPPFAALHQHQLPRAAVQHR